MAKAKRKTLTKHGLDVKTFQDEWSRQKAELEAVALEAVHADTALVDAHRALQAAQEAFKKATARKTSAESRLAALRANLGGK
jgi:hypothetical protein